MPGENLDRARPTRALVVDDERLNRQLITANLRTTGYETVEAEDGLAAWEILDCDPAGFDVILLDRRMPRMDGLALLARLKADENLCDIPVIMQTAFATEEDVAEGMKAGVYYYLAKPLDRRLLLSVVAAAVTERQRWRRLRRDLDRRATAVTLMERGRFRFRTLAEAETLAVALASACPRSRFLVVGLAEIFTNAVEHGNLGIAAEEKERLIAEKRWAGEIEARLDAPQYRDKRVTVEVERAGGEMRFTVCDEGTGFDWRTFVDLDPRRAFLASGRGIAVARRFCFDTVAYRDPGNEVVCTLRCDGEAAPLPVEVDILARRRAGHVAAAAPADGEDVRLARAMQVELLPRPEVLAAVRRRYGIAVSGFHEFSSDLGGDLWGIDPLDDRRLALWLADFSGHGVTAALNTFRMHALASHLEQARGRPAAFLGELNRRLAGALPIGQYATMLYGVLDLGAGGFSYAAAAAPPPMAVDIASLATRVGDGSGLPLGIAPGATYSERRLALQSGGVLFLASDALAENPREDGTSLGSAGARDLVRAGVAAHRGGSDVDTLLAPFLAAVRRPLRDDLTAVCCTWP